MHCINCENDAVWLFNASGVDERPYCNPHLPAAYRGTKNVNAIEQNVPQEVLDVLEEASKGATVSKSRKKAAVAVEEAAE